MSKAFQKHLIVCHLAITKVTPQIHHKPEIAGPVHDRRDRARTVYTVYSLIIGGLNQNDF